MEKKDKQFWQTFGGTVRKALGNCPLTPEQAQKELNTLKASEILPFTEDEIETSIDKILRGDLEPEVAEPDLSWLGGIDTAAVGEGVYALNRNRGDEDPEVDDQIDELRKKALDEEQPDDDEDGPGLEDRAKPPTKGR
jgi:hypothetical protein